MHGKNQLNKFECFLIKNSWTIFDCPLNIMSSPSAWFIPIIW